LKIISRSESAFHFFHLSQHVIAMIIMLPTTILAGMTLPILAFTLVKNNYGEKSIGDIYAWNTLGGMIGTIIVISFAMTWLGLKGLIILGTLIDIFTGFFIFMWMREKKLTFLLTTIIIGIS